MKNIISLLIFMMLSSSVHSESFFNNTIIGVAFINQSADFTINGPDSVVSGSDSGSGFGLYLDKYYKRTYRLNGTLSYISYSAFDISELIFSADYLYPINSHISFFGGLAAGGAIQKYTASNITDSASGLVYGAQLGAIAYINDNLMLEAGYRLRPTSIETELDSLPGAISTVDDLSETYFSILLMF